MRGSNHGALTEKTLGFWINGPRLCTLDEKMDLRKFVKTEN